MLWIIDIYNLWNQRVPETPRNRCCQWENWWLKSSLCFLPYPFLFGLKRKKWRALILAEKNQRIKKRNFCKKRSKFLYQDNMEKNQNISIVIYKYLVSPRDMLIFTVLLCFWYFFFYLFMIILKQQIKIASYQITITI